MYNVTGVAYTHLTQRAVVARACSASAIVRSSEKAGRRAQPGSATRRDVASTFASLILATVCGACLTVLGRYTTTPLLIGSVGLLPLIVLARVGKVSWGAMGGALWGLTVAVLTVALQRASQPIEASTAFFCVTILAPAAYGAMGAAITRWIGFSPFILGVMWYGVACGVAVLGFPLHGGEGLVPDSTWYHPTSIVLGHTCLALLISWISATIVMVLDTALGVDNDRAYRSSVGDCDACPIPLLVALPTIRFMNLSRAPRAPPVLS